MKLEICIYIANLTAYTEGELVGKWISLPMDENDLEEEINSIMRPRSEEEEIAIHDYESPFPIPIGEYDDPFELNKKVQTLEIDENEVEALLEIMDLDDVIEKRDFHFYYPDKRGWAGLAEELVYEYGYMEIPKHLISYIDFEMLGRDLEYSGLYHISKNGIVVELIR